MKNIKTYFKLLEEIHNYFGYVEDWCVFPIVNHLDYYWEIHGTESNGEVIYHETLEALKSDDDYYCDEIYIQRFLHKWVYRTVDYTMILSNPNTDGNYYLAIYDNSKEQK